MKIREIYRQEIEEIRNLNRSEIVEQIYYYKDGTLVLKDEYYDIKGWNIENLEKIVTDLYDLHDRGGIFYGAFIDHKLIGIIVLESKFIGSNNNQLQVPFLHIDAEHSDKGLGARLWNLVKKRAKEMGARKLYISATPSKHTIDFYLGLGCKIASEINPELYELEPEDIHLELII
ncbi:MAG: GNAT family N-acetyltransferase [Promethearchaeota archaeon]